MPHRVSDGPARGRLWTVLHSVDVFFEKAGHIFAFVIATVAVAVAAYAIINVEKQNDKLTREGIERRDQTCLFFERAAITAANNFRDAKRRYASTIVFLKNAPPDESPFLIQAVRANVPQVQGEVRQRWDEAYASQAPPYCDKPRVGLPEPNPKLPREKPRF